MAAHHAEHEACLLDAIGNGVAGAAVVIDRECFRHDHNLAAARGCAEFSTYRDDPAFQEIVARLP